MKIIATNRKARHNYFIEDEWEAGIVLVGSEVKSLRTNHCSISESYVSIDNGEAFLQNAHIDQYAQARENHEPRRARKLLLNRREINKLIAKSDKQGYTILPLSVYFNDKGKAKVKIAIAKGKKKYDKRESEKRKEWERQKGQL